jgi:hypothetical protein
MAPANGNWDREPLPCPHTSFGISGRECYYIIYVRDETKTNQTTTAGLIRRPSEQVKVNFATYCSFCLLLFLSTQME